MDVYLGVTLKLADFLRIFRLIYFVFHYRAEAVLTSRCTILFSTAIRCDVMLAERYYEYMFNSFENKRILSFELF